MCIKVIKSGKKNWIPIYNGTCYRCDARVECLQQDGHYITPNYHGEGDYVEVACPNCNYLIQCRRCGVSIVLV